MLFRSVTIATNMAGRATDIQLGGNLEIRQSNELKSSSPNEGKLNDLKNDVSLEDMIEFIFYQNLLKLSLYNILSLLVLGRH